MPALDFTDFSLHILCSDFLPSAQTDSIWDLWIPELQENSLLVDIFDHVRIGTVLGSLLTEYQQG